MSLADSILHQDIQSVQHYLRRGEGVNELDEYGFTPLIEAAIVEDIEITRLLLAADGDPNKQDVTGGTPLQWAVENNNLPLVQLLLRNGANPNAVNFSGQPVLVMPLLRRQSDLRKILIESGADLLFAQDFINAKLLGHMYELVGNATIVTPDNRFVDVDFEGFYLEVTIGIIAESLFQFQNHFAARQLRRYAGLAQYIVQVLQRGAALIKFQQYRTDRRAHQATIQQLLKQEPVLIPVGYEGHAITFIKWGEWWVKCDRREDQRLYDHVVFYRIKQPEKVTTEALANLMYIKQSDQFINEQLDEALGLIPVTELKVEAQISGNCSWANVEAAIPALFYLILTVSNPQETNTTYFKTLALQFFHRFRDWNKERALHLCMRRFQEGDLLRKATQAEMLAAILFQRCNTQLASDQVAIQSIMGLLKHSPYEYVLHNYLRIYYYEANSEEGKRFAELMREYEISR